VLSAGPLPVALLPRRASRRIPYCAPAMKDGAPSRTLRSFSRSVTPQAVFARWTLELTNEWRRYSSQKPETNVGPCRVLSFQTPHKSSGRNA